MLCVALALPGLSAGADYVNSFEAGTDIGSIQVFSSNLVIKSYEKYAGSLPAGLSLSWDDYGIYMAGTPTTAGNYSSSYNVVTENGTYSFIINLSITGGTTPTKAPRPATRRTSQSTPRVRQSSRRQRAVRRPRGRRQRR